MRRFLVGGNWKQNGTSAFAKDFPTKVLNTLKFDTKKVQVVVAPSTIHLPIVLNSVSNNVEVSAQNISQFGDGAYTGETSAEMLNDLGIKWTILGHSERRHIFGESDKVIGEKVKRAIDKKLNVMACIGETLAQRESGKTEAINTQQLSAIREHVENWDNVVIAYEPVWAIGTGKTATPD